MTIHPNFIMKNAIIRQPLNLSIFFIPAFFCGLLLILLFFLDLFFFFILPPLFIFFIFQAFIPTLALSPSYSHVFFIAIQKQKSFYEAILNDGQILHSM